MPAKRPTESVYIDILGELVRTLGHRHLLVITNRLTKLFKVIILPVFPATEVEKQFAPYWVFNYGALVDLIVDNDCQLRRSSS